MKEQEAAYDACYSAEHNAEMSLRAKGWKLGDALIPNWPTTLYANLYGYHKTCGDNLI